MNIDLAFWDEILKFMDRVVQWFKYLFTPNATWPPEDYPELDD